MNNLKKNHVFHIHISLSFYFSHYVFYLFPQAKDNAMHKKMEIFVFTPVSMIERQIIMQ